MNEGNISDVLEPVARADVLKPEVVERARSIPVQIARLEPARR